MISGSGFSVRGVNPQHCALAVPEVPYLDSCSSPPTSLDVLELQTRTLMFPAVPDFFCQFCCVVAALEKQFDDF